MQLLVTGAAGFIGYHLTKRLLEDGHTVIGIDNVNSYYDPKLKLDRLSQLAKLDEFGCFSFRKVDLCDEEAMQRIFSDFEFTHVINLAAQAGVRHSIIHPGEYIKSNLTGFGILLEQCRAKSIKHLVYASSSSVYGLNTLQPYSTHHNVDHPASLYAATKKSNELMAHSYSHIYKMPTTGLRFFTVYGSWGRPDMALYLFTEAILQEKPITVFNNGNIERDFTYIDDIIEGTIRIIHQPPLLKSYPSDSNQSDAATTSAPWRIYNIGNGCPTRIGDFIAEIEKAIGKKAKKVYLPMQPGDVISTHADVSDLSRVTGFRPSTPLREGIRNYVSWHKAYYGSRHTGQRERAPY